MRRVKTGRAGTSRSPTAVMRSISAKQSAQGEYRGLLEAAPDAMVLVNQAGEIVLLNAQAEKQFGYAGDELLGQPVTTIIPEGFAEPLVANGPRSMEDALAQVIGTGFELTARRRDGTEFPIELMLSSLHSAEGILVTAAIRDISVRRAADRVRLRLGTAVEQGSDAVIVTDLAGTIEYANPAFALLTGYGIDEAIGQKPRILRGGQTEASYRALGRRVTRGEVWTGRLTNRRKDGALYEVEATVSPIRGPDGEINGYLGVLRDVTALVAAQSALANEFRERAAVAAALSRLRAGDSAEATAAAICDELAGVPGVDVASIVTFRDAGRGFTLAVTGPEGLPVAPGRPLPAARARYLYERASQGPWAEAWRARPEDGSYGRLLAEVGLKAAAYAPIRTGDVLLGLVLVGTFDESFATHLIDQLPIVGEFAATASALLAEQVEEGRRTDVVRARTKAILATRAFHPVFQPVVELISGRTVGHEALTRFDNGTRPDEVFADAQAVGLGLELEVACLAAAITASDALAPGTWLSLNASPDLILELSTLRSLIEAQSRQIVLEITEHVAIADYAALRAALVRLGPTVSLAVDDAGSGFASLHHVVELSPRFLKLDISLVRNVDGDLTRQAMIAGLAQFAGRTASLVIAEGIEEPAELAMLRELGVPLGQGYLLGRPEPLPPASARHRRPPTKVMP
jgi:PAS domain S-box-containing protein